MPTGTEIHFGFVGPLAVWEAAKSLGCVVLNGDDEEIVTYKDFLKSLKEDGVVDLDHHLSDQLARSYDRSLAKAGWTYEVDSDSYDYRLVQSPWGPRRSGVWDLILQFDTLEIGDQIDDISLGITLSSRYFPAFVDMKNQHGTLGNTISLEGNSLIGIATDEIKKELPYFANATLYVREIFY